MESFRKAARKETCFSLYLQKGKLFIQLFWLSNFTIVAIKGLFEKWSTLARKKFYDIPFQKLVFWVSLYPEFLEKKKQRNKKS